VISAQIRHATSEAAVRIVNGNELNKQEAQLSLKWLTVLIVSDL